MKVLITGGLGFIGSHLVEKLSNKNNEIIILTKTLSKSANLQNLAKNVKIKKINLIDFQKVGRIIEEFKPDVIIHLAGNTSHSKSFEKPLQDVDSNTKTTLFMLEKIRELKSSCKFMLGSTFIVIGRPRKLPVNENTPCNPTTIYGTNRLASEHLCKIYHDVYGINTNIFRITNSYGPREQVKPNKNAVNFLIHQALKNKKISIYNKGEFFRDLIFVDDVIDCNKSLKTIFQPFESNFKEISLTLPFFNKTEDLILGQTGPTIITSSPSDIIKSQINLKPIIPPVTIL